jgi:hypothetical protein
VDQCDGEGNWGVEGDEGGRKEAAEEEQKRCLEGNCVVEKWRNGIMGEGGEAKTNCRKEEQGEQK